MNTIILKSKVMSPRNVVSNVVEGNPELLLAAAEFFTGACRSVVGYKQIQSWLNDRGYKVSISHKKYEFNGPLFQLVEETQQESSTDFEYDDKPAQVVELTTEVSEMSSEVDMDFLSLIGGTQVEVRFPEVPEEHRELFIVMVDNGVSYEDAWTALVDATDTAAIEDVCECFDEEGYRQEFTLKVAISQLQSVLFSFNDGNNRLTPTQYELNTSIKPLAKGTYKLSKVMNQFYKQHKDLLNEEDRKALVQFMTIVNEQFTSLSDEVYSNHSNYWFVSSSKIMSLPVFAEVL